MGDTMTHGGIDAKVIEVAKAGMPEPQNNEAYFIELGNWMTDYSQFRDPTSFMSGKIAVWDAGRQGAGRTPLVAEFVVNLGGYLDDLMGQPGNEGEISKWAKQVALASTIHEFCTKAEQKLDVDKVTALFEKYFTQYYPHEHLDFPPWPWGTIIGDRTVSTINQHVCDTTQPSSNIRSILQYTEEQLVYVSDRLTAVEQKWKKWVANASDGSDRQELREILCEYGHASHAVEDFFFHSNFIEIAWKSLRGPLPANNMELWHQRRFYRRLREPAGNDDGTELDKNASKPLNSVYTGYFGSKDVYHTLSDAFQGVLAKIPEHDAFKKVLGPLANFPDEDDEKASDDFRDPKKQAKALDDYRKDYRNGNITTLINAAVAANELHAKTAEAMQAALKIDDDLAKAHQGVGIKDWGITGFIQQIGTLADKEHQTSIARGKVLDGQSLINDDASDNGASGENIGSHSLMSKDSVRKEPMRAQAVNVATMVAKYVITAMLNEVYPKAGAVDVSKQHADTPDTNHNAFDTPGALDWLHLVRHFVCHPAEVEGSQGKLWCDAAMDDENAPHLHTPVPISNDELESRCKEEKRLALEKKYQEGEAVFQSQWKAMVLRDTIMDIAILLAGAAIGAYIGYKAGGAKGALAGAAIGMIAAAALVGGGSALLGLL